MQVTLTPLQSSGTQVPGIWAGNEALLGFTRWVECPTTTSTPIPATGVDKFEAVRQAIIKSFAGFVYGYGPAPDLIYNREVPVTNLHILKGKVEIATSVESNSLTGVTIVPNALAYAIVEVSGEGWGWSRRGAAGWAVSTGHALKPFLFLRPPIAKPCIARP